MIALEILIPRPPAGATAASIGWDDLPSYVCDYGRRLDVVTLAKELSHHLRYGTTATPAPWPDPGYDPVLAVPMTGGVALSVMPGPWGAPVPSPAWLDVWGPLGDPAPGTCSPPRADVSGWHRLGGAATSATPRGAIGAGGRPVSAPQVLLHLDGLELARLRSVLRAASMPRAGHILTPDGVWLPVAVGAVDVRVDPDGLHRATLDCAEVR